MKVTHRTTPVAPAPESESVSRQKVSARSYELRAPIIVTWTSGERELERGELTIGRSAVADVRLDDPLVSRTHARIFFTPDGTVVVEDLHSANGVFLNGARIVHVSGPLCEGDRLLVGTTELSLFGGRDSTTLPLEERRDSPSSGGIPVARMSVTRVARSRSALSEPRMPIARERYAEAPITTGEPRPSRPADAAANIVTERSTALTMIGRLASSLIAVGRAAEAVEVVSEHLKKILVGASAGLPVPEELLHEAGYHALRLFEQTNAREWVDYVLELHMLARRIPNLENLRALESALGRASPAVHPGVLARFVECVGASYAEMTPDERARFTELSTWPTRFWRA